MASIPDGIKDILVGASIGVFASEDRDDWGIFIGKASDSQENSITINRTGGTDANPRYLLDYPSVQIIVRASEKRWVDGEAKAQAIKDALLGLPSQDINGDRWVAVNMIGDINTLGYDENRRPLWSLNFRLIIEPATGTNRVAL